ncbi:thioredoxin-like domain-containing protein [Tenacibaculum sp. UWU-22]|uniref:thioredoxin-like domain-containing protein n=1 Tax=Tenacibaculum sp. UWU-22 TaxID=3234187 RepID=UPI0034DAD3E1
MRKNSFLLVIALLLVGCGFKDATQFSDKALHDTVVTLTNNKTTFEEVINQYKGKKVLIDVWASWCSDCIGGLPKVAKLQKQFPEVVFLFMSVDEDSEAWKKRIQQYNIQGEHYNLPKGMKKGDFVSFLHLNWIPRYLVVDEQGNITVFNATNALDDKISEALKQNTSF